MALGDAARLAGNPDSAQAAYAAVRARFDGPLAAQVAFLLGRLSLYERGEHAAAARLFDAYLREQPDGPYAREAAGLRAEALDLAGDRRPRDPRPPTTSRASPTVPSPPAPVPSATARSVVQPSRTNDARMSHRVFVAALGVAAVLWIGQARAAERGLPAIELAVAGDTPLAERLRAELGAAGFPVKLLPADEIAAACGRGEPGRPVRAVVVIRSNVTGAGATPEVCVLAQETGEVTLRGSARARAGRPQRRRCPGGAGGGAASGGPARARGHTLSTSTSTRGRGRGRDGAGTAGGGGATASRPAIHADRLLLVAAGFGATASAGATGPAPALALESWWQWRRLGLGLGVSGPAGASHLAAARESADIYPFSASAGARARLLGRDERLALFAGAGASLLWFHLRGRDAAPGHVNTAANLLVGAPHAELRLVWAIASRVSLYAAARASFAFPEPVVLFAAEEVARLGRPLVALTFGVEWRAADARPGDR